MARYLIKVYCKILNVLYLPVFLSSFLSREVGKEYSVGLTDKIQLLVKIWRNTRRIPGETSWREHILMAENILRIPVSTEGVVVECGCFKGASSASLSLACSLANRRLVIFDSFQGLPEPSDADKIHHLPSLGESHTYSRGAFCGEMKEVKANLETYGHAQVCELVPGYFEETLPRFSEECVFVFLDVDLRKSLETCLKYLWPLLKDGCRLFTHEAHHLEIAQLFFDREWWKNVDSSPPGLVSVIYRLSPSTGFWGALGYAVKSLKSLEWNVKAQDPVVTERMDSAYEISKQTQLA